jgi:hypothetical protein
MDELMDRLKGVLRVIFPLGLLAGAVLAAGAAAHSQSLNDVFAARWPSNAAPRASGVNPVRTID